MTKALNIFPLTQILKLYVKVYVNSLNDNQNSFISTEWLITNNLCKQNRQTLAQKMQFKTISDTLPLRSLFFFSGEERSEVPEGCSSRSEALFGRHLVDKM